MKKNIYIIILLSFILNTQLFAQANIASARLLGVGATVTVSGIVTNGPELGVIRYLQDNTAGLAAYDTQLAALDRGDSVSITGVLVDYNGLLEIQPVNAFVVHSSGNPIPQPLLIVPTQMGEVNEAQLVRINNVTFQNAGQAITGNTSYTLTSGASNFFIYIRSNSPMIGQVIPTGTIDLIGISSQYINDYQIIPRDYNDFILPPTIQIISPITVSNIVTDGFKLSWLTDSLGSSQVRYGRTPNLELGLVAGTPNTTTHEVILTGLNPADIIYAKCFSTQGTDTAFSTKGIYATQSLSTGNIIAYFNLSVDTTVASIQNANQLFEAIDDTLIAYIDRASETLDITIYDFNLSNISNISDAINAAYNRGVEVRVISDGSLAATNTGISAINNSIIKIPSPTTSSYGIMHNKFVIIDAKHSNPNKAIVWTGATNWQDGQINSDANNVVIFQDQSLAKAYTLEFNEMWGDSGQIPSVTNSRFGPFKTDNTPHEFNIGGKRVECYFSPSDNVNNKLINTINSSNSSMYFASMIITRFDLSQAVTDQVALGVEAFGLTHSIIGTITWNDLINGMQPAHMLANVDSANSIMHHKYLIVDQENSSSDPLVWTGSHNWSNNANNKNDENTVVIHDQNIANQFYQEFFSRFTQNGGSIVTFNVDQSISSASLFPNPNHQNNVTLIVQNNSNNNTPNTITIFDLAGKAQAQYQLTFQKGLNNLNLDIKNLESGIYFVNFNNGSSSISKKLIKY
ncbi:MAG TPA: phospholipase D-like domain-containing protein [Bacteroidia bacterium]|nr:phospholipase D-like domain-containing protein [Bacteroidia bacterium]